MRLRHIPLGADREDEKIEFVTEGKMYERAGAVYLVYEESELSGVPGCITTLRFRKHSLRMKRLGSNVGYEGELLFEKGKHYLGEYDTPYGSIQIDLLTNEVAGSVDRNGNGRITIDYQISMGSVESGRDTLVIDVAGEPDRDSVWRPGSGQNKVGEKERRDAEDRF